MVQRSALSILSGLSVSLGLGFVAAPGAVEPIGELIPGMFWLALAVPKLSNIRAQSMLETGGSLFQVLPEQDLCET